MSAATADSFEIKAANLVQLLKNTLICTSTSVKGFRAEIGVKGSDNHLRPRASRGYRCVLLTSLYSFLLVPLAVVNSFPGQLSAAWLLCPDYVV